jgi:hypothetical protein
LAVLVRHVGSQPWQSGRVHCKYLNARFVCSDIVITVYSHYPFYQNAKSSDTKCFTLRIKCFCILIERLMTVYGNYNVIAFKSCIQIFTVLCSLCCTYPLFCAITATWNHSIHAWVVVIVVELLHIPDVKFGYYWFWPGLAWPGLWCCP